MRPVTCFFSSFRKRYTKGIVKRGAAVVPNITARLMDWPRSVHVWALSALVSNSHLLEPAGGDFAVTPDTIDATAAPTPSPPESHAHQGVLASIWQYQRHCRHRQCSTRCTKQDDTISEVGPLELVRLVVRIELFNQGIPCASPGNEQPVAHHEARATD